MHGAIKLTWVYFIMKNMPSLLMSLPEKELSTNNVIIFATCT